MTGSLGGPADPAVDAAARLPEVHHAVLHRPLADRPERPAEGVGVERPQGARVAAQDLEVDDRIALVRCHGDSMRADI